MADFSALIAQIEAYVKQNGNNEITGNGLQEILVGMVNALGTVAITALQGDLADEVTARTNADSAINEKIPTEASSSNKLADKAFVTGLTTPLQNAVNAIKADIENGYAYAGIATPSGTPVGGKVFYLAKEAGTYTNFGGLVVTHGINILKYNGTAWSQEQLIGIDDEPDQESDNLFSSKGAANTYGYYVDNPDFIESKVDAKERLLEAITVDAIKKFFTKVQFNKGITLEDGVEVSGTILTDLFRIEADDIPDYIKAVVDAKHRILYAVKKDGTFVAKIEGMSELQETVSQLQSGMSAAGLIDPLKLIYYEDFNFGINKEMWKSVEWNGGGTYGSIFKADDQNWYADNGCMVLKLEKRDGLYYGPFIGTAKTLALSRGRIEARIKVAYPSDNTVKVGWCFWTFGQNRMWPEPFEFDIYEKEVTRDEQQCNCHYKDQDNEDAILSFDSVDANIFTEWHTIGLEWDENTICFYFDGAVRVNKDIQDFNSPYPMGSQDIRFNIKCANGYDEGDVYLFVDYVKVWAGGDISPVTSISQEDMTLSVGEEAYINPVFAPDGCNKAFSLTSSNSEIVEVNEFTGDIENFSVIRRIKALQQGQATLTIASANGSTVKSFVVSVE